MFDVRARGMAALAWMLGGYGLFTVCLVLAAYVAAGASAAMLVATGATSVAVPVGGLIALTTASWQTAPQDGEERKSSPDAVPTVPVVQPHGSVFVVGNGSGAVSFRVGADGVSIATGLAAAADAGGSPQADGIDASVPVVAPRRE